MSQLYSAKKNYPEFIDYVDFISHVKPTEEDIKLVNEQWKILRDIVKTFGLKPVLVRAGERIMVEDKKQIKLSWGLVIAARHDPDDVIRFWGFENKPKNTEDTKLKFLEDTRTSKSFKLPEEIHNHVILREATDEELTHYTNSLESVEYYLGDGDIL